LPRLHRAAARPQVGRPALRAGSLRAWAPLFAALGDETRLRLVSHLCESGPMSIARLTTGFDVTRQAITKHLRTMEEAGLVTATRHGRESVWELRPERLDDARGYLDLISQQWDEALGRLRDFVER
jgi:DNA-binding transcriptional ArsR family regulator